jgi:hypothetical protein
MNKQEILNSIKLLASSQGFYGRLYEQLTDESEESERFLSELEAQNFKDSVDLIMYLEC